MYTYCLASAHSAPWFLGLCLLWNQALSTQGPWDHGGCTHSIYKLVFVILKDTLDNQVIVRIFHYLLEFDFRHMNSVMTHKYLWPAWTADCVENKSQSWENSLVKFWRCSLCLPSLAPPLVRYCLLTFSVHCTLEMWLFLFLGLCWWISYKWLQNKLLQNLVLNTTNICYLPVFVGQEFRNSLAHKTQDDG